MIEEGATFKPREVGTWLDTGKPKTTFITHRYILEHGYDNSPETMRPGVSIVPPVYIHPKAIVERSVVGPYVSIGEGAEVRDSILRDTIVDEGARIEAELLEKSLIGRWVELDGQFRRLNLGDSSTES